MRSSTVASAFAVSLFSLMSAACGGGGGGGSSVVPAAPAQVTLTPGSRSLTVAWAPVAGATEYNVYVASVPGVTDTNYGLLPEGAHAPATPHLSVTFDGLVEGGTYFVIVEGKSAAGTGPHSGELQTTLRPGTPGAPVMQPGIAEMDVTWSGVLGAASYDLYLGTEPGLTSTSAGGVHYPGIVPPFHMTGLENGKTYFALITATNAAGTSLDSPVSSGAPSGRGTFAEIPGLTGVAGLKDSVSGLFDGDTNVDFAVDQLGRLDRDRLPRRRRRHVRVRHGVPDGPPALRRDRPRPERRRHSSTS